ncbi:translesion DNA synthesis-associated protein ImuA [Pelomonas sp. SE-A7]|uniref:translesion DNA synthesis-associated protein ImuA n=1 Tax=Pelomonas sp. SE-A7 TaxID=3054953 RepID=UPI00338F8837
MPPETPTETKPSKALSEVINSTCPPEPRALPPGVEAALWRGDQLGRGVELVAPTGFAELDAELPGGGWGCQGLTEVLTAQFALLEWRLTSPALRAISNRGRDIVVVGPPRRPFPPSLQLDGIDPERVLWVDVDKPGDRLWATEQAVKSNACGAVLAWLPQIRADQVRRLQVLAAGCDAPVFLFRTAGAAAEASAAPLRLQAQLSEDWELRIRILKRRGTPCEQELRLESIPCGLNAIMTPRLRYPSRITSRVPDALVRTSTPGPQQQAVPH